MSIQPRSAERSKRIASTILSGAFAVLLLAASSGALLAANVTIYNSVPSPLPGNVPSLGFQATQTAEFGELIQFAGTNRVVNQVTVVMSDWALRADWPTFGDAVGWDHPITLILYNVDNSGANPAPGTVIASVTQTFHIPWRPVADPTCVNDAPFNDATNWRDSTGVCQFGLATPITFTLPGTVVPDQIIFGVAFNTQNSGAVPIGTPGPYNSFNLGLPSTVITGSNPFIDTAYWNTANAGFYTDGGAAGVGVFRRDTAWTPFLVGADFEAAAAVGITDLSLTKTASATVVTDGADFIYTIVATNGGPDQATGVIVTDPLPAGITATSATSSVGTCTLGATVTCNVGTLADGESATITIHATGSTTRGNVSNTASVTSDQADPDTTNNAAAATVFFNPAAVPASGPLSLAILLLLLAATGIFATRAR